MTLLLYIIKEYNMNNKEEHQYWYDEGYRFGSEQGTRRGPKVPSRFIHDFSKGEQDAYMESHPNAEIVTNKDNKIGGW